MRLVLAHGGTTSTPRQRHATRKAAEAGLAAMEKGPLEAVVEACRVLEDDPRFHAGTGSTLRMDGWTIEMDAACTDSGGRFGAVGAIQRVRNPVLVARVLADLPNSCLVGPGAVAFARRLGMPDHDPTTDRARKEWTDQVRKIEKGKSGPDENEWDEDRLRRHWNYERPFAQVFPHGFPKPKRRSSGAAADTVGAVATDGTTFAAAASTSGMTAALLGRVGDTIMLGSGLLATPDGAAVCSGNGDHILRRRTASRVLSWVASGTPARAAARRAIEELAPGIDGAVVLVTPTGHVVEGNRAMAHSVARDG